MSTDYFDDIAEPTAKPGTVLFLSKITPEHAPARWELSDEPCRTNIGFKPILHGWCGSTYNTSVEALGLVEVVRETRFYGVSSGYYRRLSAEETETALSKLGWVERDGQLERLPS